MMSKSQKMANSALGLDARLVGHLHLENLNAAGSH